WVQQPRAAAACRRRLFAPVVSPAEHPSVGLQRAGAMVARAEVCCRTDPRHAVRARATSHGGVACACLAASGLVADLSGLVASPARPRAVGAAHPGMTPARRDLHDTREPLDAHRTRAVYKRSVTELAVLIASPTEQLPRRAHVAGVVDSSSEPCL